MLKINRQAVVIIHGIGEQRPMDSLRAFVNSIAPEIKNSKTGARKVFNKPDNISDSFELRRYTSNNHADSHKTDYFEYYWGHKVSGKSIRDILRWFWAILFRTPKNVPKRVRWIYFNIWFILLIGVLALIAYFFSLTSFNFIDGFLKYIKNPYILSIYGILATGVSSLAINYLGDVVCYTITSPKNINEREEIRRKGIELLEKLHNKKEEDGSELYDRIVIVGHSLGTIIAYDLINILFSRYNKVLNINKESIKELENAAVNLNEGKINCTQFQEIQTKAWIAQYNNLNSWKISDFITFGSPLAISDLLLAKNKIELKEKQLEREFPTCPPTPEKQNKFHYDENTLHHAAHFALTKWTNICFRKDFVGDNIEIFGKGIKNEFRKSESYIHNLIPFIAHTRYWSSKENKMVELIRKTINLKI
jgi:hypothetical protein